MQVLNYFRLRIHVLLLLLQVLGQHICLEHCIAQVFPLLKIGLHFS